VYAKLDLSLLVKEIARNYLETKFGPKSALGREQRELHIEELHGFSSPRRSFVGAIQ
jgi:hypothetical protein